jgi:heparin/heparan-sulfate lyase
MRSSWKPDAAFVSFDCGPRMSYHDHADQGNFTIFRNGFLAHDSGIYSGQLESWATDYYTRTVAHNTITVRMPGETFKVRGKAAANDGGQTWGTNEISSVSDVQSIGKTPFRGGKIIALDYTDQYTYIVGDVTPAYRPGKVKDFKRHLLYLRPDIVVVFDRVTAGQASYTKTWHLHTTGKPVVSGTVVSADCQQGKLFCRALLPAEPVISVIDHYEVDGKQVKPALKPVLGEWRIDVKPSRPTATTLFAHVLYAARSGTPRMPACEVKAKGELVEITAGRFRVILHADGRPGGLLMVHGRKVDLPGTVRKQN